MKLCRSLNRVRADGPKASTGRSLVPESYPESESRPTKQKLLPDRLSSSAEHADDESLDLRLADVPCRMTG